MTEAANQIGLWPAFIASSLGLLSSNCCGYLLCRYGGRKLFHRLVGDGEYDQLKVLLHRYGSGLIIMTRAVPMMPEIISAFAGMTSMNFKVFIIANLFGSLPLAFYCSYIGVTVESRVYEMLLAILFSFAAFVIYHLIFRYILKAKTESV
ncbi:MAG: VTT domain-containing protein [Planctomycetes bacterium]|nr:VTT domain-containing protein [Planctomycetota bacterium]